MERLCQGLSIGDDFTGILYILFYMHFENIYVDPLKRGFWVKLPMIPSGSLSLPAHANELTDDNLSLGGMDRWTNGTST